MKKLKFVTLSLAVFAYFLTFLNPLEAHARMDDDIKKIQEEHCTDEEGNLTGFGNTCVAGNGKCERNKC